MDQKTWDELLTPSKSPMSDDLFKRFFSIRKQVNDKIKIEVANGTLHNTYSDKSDQDKVKSIDLFAPHPKAGFYVPLPKERVHEEVETWFTENLMYFMDEDLRKNKLGQEHKPVLNEKRLLIVSEPDIQTWYKELSQIWVCFATYQHLDEELKKKCNYDVVKRDFDKYMSDPIHEYQMKLLYNCKFVEDYPFMADFLTEGAAGLWGMIYMFDFCSEYRMAEFVSLLNYKNEQLGIKGNTELGSIFAMQYIQTKMSILNMFDPRNISSTKYLGHMLNVLSAYLTFEHFDNEKNKDFLIKAIEMMLEKGKKSTAENVATYCKEISDGFASALGAATSLYEAGIKSSYQLFEENHSVRFQVRNLNVYFENIGNQMATHLGHAFTAKKNLYKTIGGLFKLGQMAVFVLSIFSEDYWQGTLNTLKGQFELTCIVVDLANWLPTGVTRSIYDFFSAIGSTLIKPLRLSSNSIIYKGLTIGASRVFSLTTASFFVSKVFTPALSILTIIISFYDLQKDWTEGNTIGVFCDIGIMAISAGMIALCFLNSIESFGATLVLGLLIVALNLVRYITTPDPLIGYFKSDSFPKKYKF
eukprot:gene6710-8311_t